MEVITYSLKNGCNNSDIYYNDISLFTDEVLVKLEEECTWIIEDFVKFIRENNIEKVRQDKEYMVEILSIGVFIYLYRDKSIKLNKFSQRILTFLSKIRYKAVITKLPLNKIKGVLSTIILNKSNGQATNEKQLNIRNFLKVIDWMEASGDYKCTVNRLKNWYSFLKNKPDDYSKKIINKLVQLALWFKIEANKKISKYTYNVNNFLLNKYKEHKFKEDILFCGRNEIEYHLNMIGAEILNRAFQDDFINAEKKMVLLPACMRFYLNKNCKAINTTNGYMCRHCTKQCNVNIINQLGEKNNFETYIIPHESDIFSSGKSSQQTTGVVGIACVLNLLEGGWKAKELNFIPQCVILDYCGCQNHWSKSGFSTSINLSELKKIIKIYP